MSKSGEPSATWRKSTRSNGSGECVEVAGRLGGLVSLRDSKNPSGPILTFTPARWTAFIEGIKDSGLRP